MTITQMAPAELTATAIKLLCQEIGIVNTARFINQFTAGYGNYTLERDQLFGQMTVENIVSEMKRQHQQHSATVASIAQIEAISEEYAAKLAASAVTTTEQLLQKGASSEGRAEIATRSGINQQLILEWVGHTDLMRINGIGWEYADLLEAAGINTIPDLADHTAENLLDKLSLVNTQKKLVRRLPTLKQMHTWVEQAKTLSPVITD